MQKKIHNLTILLRLSVWLGVPVAIVLGVLFWFFQQSLPKQQGMVKLVGLNAEVQISRDKHSVVYLQGQTDHDVFFALGYAHAQDRLWQMEINRRIAAGRISEIIGSPGIATDRLSRILGFYKNSEKTWKELTTEEQSGLQAYVSGINQWLQADHVLPPEFLWFGVEPEPWTVVDSLSWLHVMSWGLSGNLSAEINRTVIGQRLGWAAAETLMPTSERQETSTANLSAQTIAGLNDYLQVQNQFAEHSGFFGQALGSNNWVVAGALTVSGMPLLANDPHLQVGLPSPFYLAELQGKTIRVKGATFPGLPFVVAGQNQDIAWGITNMGADVQDVFIERVNPENVNEYELDGQYIPMQVDQEKINVRGEFLKGAVDSIPIQIRRTVHGPLLSDVTGSDRLNAVYSLKWVGDGGLGGTYSSFFKLNYASNWQQFVAALKPFIAPSQNFIFADKHGDIGYQAAGKIPVRSNGKGSVATIGWSSENAWLGWVPFEDLPQQYNPPGGIIVTANNKTVTDSYPYHLTSDWAPAYRAHRITSLLTEKIDAQKKLGIQDMTEIQADVSDLQAQELLPYLRKLSERLPDNQEVSAALANWDYRYTLDSVAASIYQSWLENFTRLVFEDEVRQMKFLGWDMTFLLTNFRPEVLRRLSEEADNPWCDHQKTIDVQETCEDIAILALDHAVQQLRALAGNRIADWQWGKLHITHYAHFPFSRGDYQLAKPKPQNSILEYFFHREIDSPGSRDTINVGATKFNDRQVPFLVTINAAYRQIIDLSNDQDNLFSISTGQSANVFSEHYDDLIQQHRDNQYIPIDQQGVVSTLVLAPRN